MTEIVRTMARASADIGAVPYRVDIRAGHHSLIADEGTALGGADAGASPFGLLLASLAACTAMTLKMYAERKEWPLDGLHVDLRIARTGDALGIDRTVTLSGALDETQRARLADIVERTPVTLAIKQGVPIATQFLNGAGGEKGPE
jgi:putative redox protein